MSKVRLKYHWPGRKKPQYHTSGSEQELEDWLDDHQFRDKLVEESREELPDPITSPDPQN